MLDLPFDLCDLGADVGNGALRRRLALLPRLPKHVAEQMEQVF
ncbi:hypothetical protein [Bauldia litoralis]